MAKQIKIGSRDMWRGSRSADPAVEAKVEHIEETQEPHEKDGREVAFIDFEDRECSVIDLDNGHWCYGDQIVDVLDDEEQKAG